MGATRERRAEESETRERDEGRLESDGRSPGVEGDGRYARAGSDDVAAHAWRLEGLRWVQKRDSRVLCKPSHGFLRIALRRGKASVKAR